MSTTAEKINQMYDAQLKSQKEQLDTDYAQAVLDLDAQQKKNQQYTDTNLNRTAVEAQKAAVNNAELHNAYGLSSGARAQARLSQENQLQADMTAIRAAQQNADADVERQRSVLAQEYASAIRQAQAENDLAKAQALYQNAKEAEARLLARQEAAAKLMAETGDYSRLGALYGLSAKEIAALSGTPEPSPEPETEPNAGFSLKGALNKGASFAKELWDFVKNANADDIEAFDNLPIDESSVNALGFGPLTADELYELVEIGLVDEYVENGYVKFRKSQSPATAAPGTAAWAGLDPLGLGG